MHQEHQRGVASADAVVYTRQGPRSRSGAGAADVVAGAARFIAAARDANTLGGVGLPLSVWYLDGQMIAISAVALHDGDALTAYARCLNDGSEGMRP